ncbi:hypothetical protein ADUPG1_007000 [Aduncisulcus paluster]|uniref:Palmitoyltransferase n=1 Tax=Aduncisulcus paluster TaxID=2918883 RepID=A0ABQ5KKB0_9EUKA|nr:hypothetical protein ADUPG1_007000 [Aduncisulcus paluster]
MNPSSQPKPPIEDVKKEKTKGEISCCINCVACFFGAFKSCCSSFFVIFTSCLVLALGFGGIYFGIFELFEKWIFRIPFLLLVVYSVFMTLWYYYFTVFSDPGTALLLSEAISAGHLTIFNQGTSPHAILPEESVKDEDVAKMRDVEEIKSAPPMLESEDSPVYIWKSVRVAICPKCNRVRGPRTHHCGFLKKCVHNYDHYCPWVANDVGYRNHGYFLMFLLWGTVGLLIISASSVTALIQSLIDGSIDDVTGMLGSFVTVIFGLMMFISVFFMFIIHIKLVRNNETTVEYYDNNRKKRLCREKGLTFRNIFDLGTSRNVQEVLGKTPWKTVFLPQIIKLSSDGVIYPTNTLQSESFFAHHSPEEDSDLGMINPKILNGTEAV